MDNGHGEKIEPKCQNSEQEEGFVMDLPLPKNGGMRFDRRDHLYYMIEAMLEHIEFWIQYQVPGIVPWHLLAAQCRWESGFNHDLVGPGEAKGIAQITPRAWEWLSDGDPFDPNDAVKAQAQYLLELAMLHAMTDKPTPFWWIVSYSWGFGLLQKEGWDRRVPIAILDHAARVIETSEYYRFHLGYTSDFDRYILKDL